MTRYQLSLLTCDREMLGSVFYKDLDEQAKNDHKIRKRNAAIVDYITARLNKAFGDG